MAKGEGGRRQVGPIENLKAVVKTVQERNLQPGNYLRWKHANRTQIASASAKPSPRVPGAANGIQISHRKSVTSSRDLGQGRDGRLFAGNDARRAQAMGLLA